MSRGRQEINWGDVWSSFVVRTGEVAEKIGEGATALDKFMYQHGKMLWMDTSPRPVFYDQSLGDAMIGLINERRKKPGRPDLVTVSVPLTLDGERIRAARSHTVSDTLQKFDVRYPTVLVNFQDPIESATGDEVLAIEATGSALDVFRDGITPSWQLYIPGRQEICITGNGKPLSKPQAEMTAADVAEMLVNKIRKDSEGKLVVSSRDMIIALRMITKRSESMKQRWDILDQRLKFQMHLMERGHVVAAILRDMVHVDREDFKSFLNDLNKGEIRGWGDFLDRIDNIPSLVVGRGGAVLSRLMYTGTRLLPDPKGRVADEEAVEIPSSLLISLPGLTYFNTLLKIYVEKTEPEVAKVAETVGKSQVEAVKIAGNIAEARLRSLQGANKELKDSIPQLSDKLKRRIGRLVSDLEGENNQVLSGSYRVIEQGKSKKS